MQHLFLHMKAHHYELQDFMMPDQILNMSDHFKVTMSTVGGFSFDHKEAFISLCRHLGSEGHLSGSNKTAMLSTK